MTATTLDRRTIVQIRRAGRYIRRYYCLIREYTTNINTLANTPASQPIKTANQHQPPSTINNPPPTNQNTNLKVPTDQSANRNQSSIHQQPTIVVTLQRELMPMVKLGVDETLPWTTDSQGLTDGTNPTNDISADQPTDHRTDQNQPIGHNQNQPTTIIGYDEDACGKAFRITCGLLREIARR